MRMSRVAGDERIEAFDFMDEAAALQEFNRAVNGGWLGIVDKFTELGEDVVGADRLFAFGDDRKHQTAWLGKADAVFLAMRFDLGQ